MLVVVVGIYVVLYSASSRASLAPPWPLLNRGKEGPT